MPFDKILKTIFKTNNNKNQPHMPQTKQIVENITQHGETRTDKYGWLRAVNWKDVLKDPKNLDDERRKHLESENNYTKSHMKGLDKLTKGIGDELVSRIIPTESSIPDKHGDWEYWVEYREKGNYPVHKRRNLKTAQEQMVFDGDKEADGHTFFDIGSINHSPDHKYMTYAIDIEGSEYYKIRVREIETGKEFSEVITKTSGYCVWSEDSSRFYYVELDDNHKTKNIKCHVLGDDAKNDITVYHEKDDGYFLSVYKGNSGKYIMIGCSNSETSETRFFNADAKEQPDLKLVRAREDGVQYGIQHHGDHFYIQTNQDGATEFKIMKTPVDAYTEDNWQEYLPARDGITLKNFTLLKDYMIRCERSNALTQIIVCDYSGNEYKLEMPDEAYDLGYSTGYEFDTDTMRLYYDTMAHPGLTFEVDLKTGNKKIIKERQLPNGHNPDEYVIERDYVTARDGEKVPVTLIRHKSVKPDGTAPLHVYGYGSYGITMEAEYASSVISLVDRGIVYAIAHVRGGGDKGEAWHKAGKKMNKKNTFNDFIDVTESLIAKGYGKKGEVTMEGRSAGGMLMGAVVNMRPDLYGFVIAGVPFVDVLNTISDATLPLTPPEWEEWGNPIKDKEAFDYMKSYSPYENIQKEVTYPIILAPAGLTDPRVTYWEPAKWIARLREEAKGGPFLLKMNMGGGHFGNTGRYGRVRERADEYSLLVHFLEGKGYDMRMRVNYPVNAKSAKPTKNTP